MRSKTLAGVLSEITTVIRGTVSGEKRENDRAFNVNQENGRCRDPDAIVFALSMPYLLGCGDESFDQYRGRFMS